MTQTATLTRTATVRIDYTQAPLIRCTAKQDMPQYGIKAGDVFYLARSSKDNGEYYVVRWDYARMGWFCYCPATCQCRHTKAVSEHCYTRCQQKATKPAPAAAKPAPTTRRMETAPLNGNRPFSILKI